MVFEGDDGFRCVGWFCVSQGWEGGAACDAACGWFGGR